MWRDTHSQLLDWGHHGESTRTGNIIIHGGTIMRKPIIIAISLAITAPVLAGKFDALQNEARIGSGQNALALTQLNGIDVYNREGETIGDVDRLVLKDGNRTAIIHMDVNADAKKIAVPFTDLSVTDGGKGITVGYSRSALETLPDVASVDFRTLDSSDRPNVDTPRDHRTETPMSSTVMASRWATSLVR